MFRDTKEALQKLEKALLEEEETCGEEETEEAFGEDTEAYEDEDYENEDEEYEDEPAAPQPRSGGISCLAALALMLLGGIAVMLGLFVLKMYGIV